MIDWKRYAFWMNTKEPEWNPPVKFVPKVTSTSTIRPSVTIRQGPDEDRDAFIERAWRVARDAPGHDVVAILAAEVETVDIRLMFTQESNDADFLKLALADD